MPGGAALRGWDVVFAGPASEAEFFDEVDGVGFGGVEKCHGGSPQGVSGEWGAVEGGVETTTPRPADAGSGCGVESAGNDLLSPWKDYHRPQVLIVRVRDGNASFHLGVITGKLPDMSETTWWGTK